MIYELYCQLVSNMNYEKINKFDSANGPGIRTSLFVCGCPIHCPGCFNKELQNFDYGQKFDKEAEEKILEYLSHPHVRGFTLLGGEPLSYSNRMSCYLLLKHFWHTLFWFCSWHILFIHVS